MHYSSLSDNHTLHYLDPNPQGKRGILLLHGLGSSCESWGFQFPVLIQAGYRPIAPDMPGFGRTRYTGSFSIPGMAKSAVDLLQKLQMPRVHVVGISMGGAIALQLASSYPECVDGLVLVNTFARLRPGSPSRLLYYTRRLFVLYVFGLHRQAELVAQRLFPKPEQAFLRKYMVEHALQTDPRAYRAAFRAFARYNLENKLESISAPTLVVTAEQDDTISPAIQKTLLKIPGSRQVLIPGAGHAVIADSPQEFNRALMQFLRACDRRFDRS